MDRFYRGFVAGISGGILMTIWDLISFHLLDFTEHRYLDWCAVMLLGDRPSTIIEAVYALFTHLVWAGFLGIIFAFIVKGIGEQGLLAKGVIIGFIIGFLLYTIPKLFQTGPLYATPIESVISNHLGAVIWGLTTAYVLHLLNKKYEETGEI